MVTARLTALVGQGVWNGMGGHGGWMWGMHWLWWIFWIALAGLLIWVLVSAVGGSQSDGTSRGPDREPPEETLRRRYAEGEIDEEELRERLRVLRREEDAED